MPIPVASIAILKRSRLRLEIAQGIRFVSSGTRVNDGHKIVPNDLKSTEDLNGSTFGVGFSSYGSTIQHKLLATLPWQLSLPRTTLKPSHSQLELASAELPDHHLPPSC